ncbi:hypothetical protein BD779DRAFT_1502039 [Infundibulicybe gibba]|nr:hypothetical protein BD779DRAFT_1502039 [Infundibulicybe gibba]
MIILDAAAIYIPGPYARPAPAEPTVIPSLSALCVQLLTPFPDQVHQIHPVRLHYRRMHAQIVPDPAVIDPRLWINLVQIYDRLPPSLRTLRIPLADVHLPLLQRIPQSSSFSLITLLDLSSCSLLTDASLSPLNAHYTHRTRRVRHLDISAAFRSLASALLGPWSLRILRLCNCVNITDNIYPHLTRFPLLSAADLRGTSCDPNAIQRFHYALDSLRVPGMHSSDSVFTIYIDKLQHPKPKPGHLKTGIKHSRWIGPPARRLAPPADNSAPTTATSMSTVRSDAFYASPPPPTISEAFMRRPGTLMLYRPPPLAPVKEKQVAMRASVDRARMEAMGAPRSAKRERIYEPERAPVSEAKNPFRRNTDKVRALMPTFGSPLLPLRRASEPTPVPAPLVAKPASRSRPVPQNKPLIPISRVRVPVLSPKTHARALAEEQLLLRSTREPTLRQKKHKKEKKVQQRLDWGAWGKVNGAR